MGRTVGAASSGAIACIAALVGVGAGHLGGDATTLPNARQTFGPMVKLEVSGKRFVDEPPSSSVPGDVSRKTSAVEPRTRLMPGRTVHGVLQPSQLWSGRPSAVEYNVHLGRGERIDFLARPEQDARTTVELSLALQLGPRLVAHDDAGAGSREREIAFTPTEAGVYVLRLSALSTATDPVAYALDCTAIPASTGPAR